MLLLVLLVRTTNSHSRRLLLKLVSLQTTHVLLAYSRCHPVPNVLSLRATIPRGSCGASVQFCLSELDTQRNLIPAISSFNITDSEGSQGQTLYPLNPVIRQSNYGMIFVLATQHSPTSLSAGNTSDYTDPDGVGATLSSHPLDVHALQVFACRLKIENTTTEVDAQRRIITQSPARKSSSKWTALNISSQLENDSAVPRLIQNAVSFFFRYHYLY